MGDMCILCLYSRVGGREGKVLQAKGAGNAPPGARSFITAVPLKFKSANRSLGDHVKCTLDSIGWAGAKDLHPGTPAAGL